MDEAMSQSNSRLHEAAQKVDEIAWGLNSVLQDRDEAVKEFQIAKKQPDHCHRTRLLDTLDQVLADHGFSDLYIAEYSPKERLRDYRNDTCVPRMKNGVLTANCRDNS